MAVIVGFLRNEDRARAMRLMRDTHFVVGVGFLISNADLEILKREKVKFEVNPMPAGMMMEMLSQ
jgi:hypothetical protein